jgi:hypothetical protein
MKKICCVATQPRHNHRPEIANAGRIAEQSWQPRPHIPQKKP